MTTILITGGAGFIGSHLTSALLKDGYKVVAVDDFSTGSSGAITQEINFYQMDLADKKLGEVFAYNDISYVFHLAAQTNVPLSVSSPVKDAQINVLGTVNLLEKCQAFAVKKVIYLSGGAAVYGEVNEPATETSPLKPVSPLGLSKATAERYLELANRMTGLDYTILRCANVYGPGQDPFRDVGVVASFCQFMLNNHPPTIYGDGEQTRDFFYIEDLIAALKQTLIEGSGEIINVGSGTSLPIQEIYRKIKELTGFAGEPYYRPSRAGNIQRFSLNVEKAAKVLKWRAKTDINAGLTQTVEYYKQAQIEG